MAKETVNALVDGGKATAGPPLGPALGPLGVNAAKVVEEINKKTAGFTGMKVPIKIVVDIGTKTFEVQVGSPPTSALIKKELGLEKGAKDATPAGNASIEQVLKVADMKRDSLLANSRKAALNEVLGVCGSVGITIDGKPAKEVIRVIKKGKYSDDIKPEEIGKLAEAVRDIKIVAAKLTEEEVKPTEEKKPVEEAAAEKAEEKKPVAEKAEEKKPKEEKK